MRKLHIFNETVNENRFPMCRCLISCESSVKILQQTELHIYVIYITAESTDCNFPSISVTYSSFSPGFQEELRLEMIKESFEYLLVG